MMLHPLKNHLLSNKGAVDTQPVIEPVFPKTEEKAGGWSAAAVINGTTAHQALISRTHLIASVPYGLQSKING